MTGREEFQLFRSYLSKDMLIGFLGYSVKEEDCCEV